MRRHPHAEGVHERTHTSTYRCRDRVKTAGLLKVNRGTDWVRLWGAMLLRAVFSRKELRRLSEYVDEIIIYSESMPSVALVHSPKPICSGQSVPIAYASSNARFLASFTTRH